MNYFHLTLFSLILIFSFSCQQKKSTGVIHTKEQHKTEEKIDPFVEGNKNIVRQEDEEIDLFIKRYAWNMQKSGSGLRIEILKEGTGETFTIGDTVSLDYQLFLLDGTLLYSSDNDGKKSFVIGKSQELTGLHEAVQYLKKGGEARLVLPSYLAYGVAGDGDKIKGRKSIALTINIDK